MTYRDEPVTLDASEAKPCPFCGSQPTMQYWHGGGPLKRLIECKSDECPLKPGVTGENEAVALGWWNTRAPVFAEEGGAV